MIDAETKWDGDNALKMIVQAGWERLLVAVYFLVEQLRQTLGKTGPSTRAKYTLHGKQYSEKVCTPSSPGSPPFKRTGNLQVNVQAEVDESTHTARVGITPNALYGLWLEMGLPGGKDLVAKTGKALRFFSAAAGKFIWRKRVKQGALKARPWFMVTLQRVWPQMQELMGIGQTRGDNTEGGSSGDRAAG